MSDRLRQVAAQAADTAVSLTRPSYFDSKERGELPELRKELLSDTYLVRREAVRKVIAGMTAGGKDDYGELFPEILRCLQSKDVETKRLVYLYLTTYAEDRPDMALLAVNTIVKDSEERGSGGAVVRSLALRTMGGLRIPNLVDYIDDPLRRALKDENFMVRRTAAVCIGKLFVNNREYFDDMELTSALQQLLSDSDPFVASNAVAVVLQHYDNPDFSALIDSTVIARLSVTMEKAGEWGQLNILTLWLRFAPKSTEEQAMVLLRKSAAFLAHGNAAVAIAACRVILSLLARFPDSTAQYDRRVSTSLTSVLCGTETTKEMQYVVLRMLIGGVKEMPSIQPPLSAVMVTPNDASFVKRAKVELMSAMADRQSLLAVLSELTEYAKDMDIHFAEFVVSEIGRLCGRFAGIDTTLRRVILNLLVELGRTGVGHLLKASVTALRLVYTDDDRHAVPTVMACFLHDPGQFDSAESRASLVWLVARCDDLMLAEQVLDVFDIRNEALTVQLQLLDTAYILAVDGPFKAFTDYAMTAADSATLNRRARLLRQLTQAGMAQIKVNYDECVERPLPVPDWFMSEFGLLSTVYHRAVCTGIGEADCGDDNQTVSSVADYLTDFL